MSDPIRVLQVFAQMNRGGAETMIMNLYRNIDRSKVQFDFIVHTQEKCAFDDEIEKLGGRIFRVPKYNGKNHFVYTKTWEEFMLNHPEYKIIHGHVRSTASIYLKICKKHGRLTIAHSHSTTSGSGLTSIVKNVMQYPIRNIADYFFACSAPAGKWLFGNEIVKNDNYYLLNNSVETKKYTYNEETRMKIRKKYNLTNKFVVGHVGRFHPLKNHDFIIEVFEKVKSIKGNSILLLVGDGELKNKVQEKVKQHNLSDNVIFAGVRSDVPDLLQAMDVFLMPSIFEGLPVSLIESQASGLKTVVSDTITRDVNITNLIEFMSLEEPASYWAEHIMLNGINYKRNDTGIEISKAGYDVKENAAWLENFYLNHSA